MYDSPLKTIRTMHHHPSSTGAAAYAAVRYSPYILLSTIIFSLLLIFSLSIFPSPPRPPSQPHPLLFPHHHRVLFNKPTSTASASQNHSSDVTPPRPPSIAYFISGSANDSGRIIRLLHSIYHPKNHYLLHLDRSAKQSDREALAVSVQSVPIFVAAQNVHVIGKADYVFNDGPSRLSSTLHGAALLLRLSGDWDWFINLGADDYPLMTQDDLLHIFSYLPRDLNFVNHTGYIGWRESRKLKPIVVDNALFLEDDSEMFYATQKRQLPNTYRLFTGSSSVVLSRKFIEFCITGTDNFPRTLLMYLSNTFAANTVYFPTILCNSHQFNRTIINHSLQYTSLDYRHEPSFLNSSAFSDLIQSGAMFASPLQESEQVLDRIDRELLHRNPGNNPVPGGWCLGDSGKDKCSLWGDADVLRPGPGAKRLEERLIEILSGETVESHQCIDE